MIDIHIQEMYKYRIVLALDSLKDLEASFNSHEVKMFKYPLQHPPVQCQHHHHQCRSRSTRGALHCGKKCRDFYFCLKTTLVLYF